jgi:hypothetical protein
VSRWPEDYRVELEAFWRSHHEAWLRSDLNQREYCEAHGLPLKRFGNWRAKFKQEPEAPQKLLSRRCGESASSTVSKADTQPRRGVAPYGPSRAGPACDQRGNNSHTHHVMRTPTLTAWLSVPPPTSPS